MSNLGPPWIKCDTHGVVKGYLVCSHLFFIDSRTKLPHRNEQYPIKAIRAPMGKELGLMHCGAKQCMEFRPGEVVLMCEQCLAFHTEIKPSDIGARVMID